MTELSQASCRETLTGSVDAALEETSVRDTAIHGSLDDVGARYHGPGAVVLDASQLAEREPYGGLTLVPGASESVVLFYNAGTGSIATARVDADGTFTGLKEGGGLSTGWTDVVPIGRELLFYNAGSG